MIEKIIDSCQYVVNNSKHVSIDYHKIDEIIKNIDCSNLKFWLADNPYDLFGLGISNVVNFLLIFESIDYSFWGNPKWTIATDDGKKDGSDALLYALLKYVKEKNSTDFSNVPFDEFCEILKGNTDIPLLKERYNTVVEVSNIVNDQMDGNFYQHIKNITTDTDLLHLIITKFPSFQDIREYDGKTIYFYKLAQLLVSDILHMREFLENISVDYTNLLGCADYKIPQTLRTLEIVKYDVELSEIVDNKNEIAISSVYEVEIRASMLIVINYIQNKMKNVNAIDINDYLFLLAKKIKLDTKPYHLCRNTNY